MKLKLTKAEMQTLELIVDSAVNKLKTETAVGSMLLAAVMERFFVRLASRLIILKPRYTLKIDADAAFAFVIVFQERRLNPQNFEDNLILKLINTIKQHYALC